MSAEADAASDAGYGERCADRANRRSGYRHRDFDTRAGTTDVPIPQAALRHRATGFERRVGGEPTRSWRHN